MAAPTVVRLGSSLLIIVLMMSLHAERADAQYFRFGKNKVQYEAQDWKYIQTTHFDIFYYDEAYELADFTARAAEDAYHQISSLFRYQISDRIPLIVYKSHNDFAVTNAVDLPTYSEGIGGVTELFKNRVAIPFMGDYRDYRRVLHHELVHAVINDMFYGGSLQSILQNNIRLRIPLWFNEGLAEYSALGWDTNSDMYIRDAILEDDLAPIEYLNGYYAYRGGQSVWDYIAAQYGPDKVSEILQRLRLSRSINESFKRSTGLSLEELSERWHQSLREIHYPELAAREDLDRIARPLITREEGYLNTSPALSPRGDRLAYVSTRGAFFDVYLASVSDGKVIRRLINGQDNSDFESLRILSPGLTWSPDGRQIAVAVKSKHTEAVAVVDVETGEAQHYRTPEVDQIYSVAWNPRGHQIAFAGSKNGSTDIYVLDIGTRQISNLTQDVFSDHEPTWRPDGRAIVFHSDRGDRTRLASSNSGIYQHDFSRYDLYLIELDGQGGTVDDHAVRLTIDEHWDNQSARFGDDPQRLLFVSDRNGVFNVYEKNLETGAERPVTDVVRGVMQLAVSGDGNRAALVSLKRGVPSIFILNDPFRRTLEDDQLKPNVWAQRVNRDSLNAAPALAVASATVRQSNPFVRAASDDGGIVRWNERLAELREIERILDSSDRVAENEAGGANGSEAADSTTYGGVRVDFRNYVFDESFEEVAQENRERYELLDPFDPPDNLEEDGSYREKKYRLRFSPDIVYGTAGYDVLYGVQGVTQMLFSDMLGNHQIFVATNLLIDLRNSDYVITYTYLPRRIDWSASSYHISRLLPDYNRLTYYRYRQYGTSVAASYPLDKFRRLDSEFYVLGVSQTDIGEPARPTANRLLLYPSLTYTLDFTTPGVLSPIGGRRIAMSLSGSPLAFRGGNSQFVTLLGDARFYTSFGRGAYTFALRFSGGASFGPGQQLFFSSGTQNWINRRFDDDNGFPIDDVTDFVFARPVLPLRGFDINAGNGSNFGLVNAEFRFPIVAALLPGPLPILPLYHLQGTAFADAGGIWGGRGNEGPIRIVARDEFGVSRFEDVMVGAGLGLRTILLGFPVRLDYAWPFDGQSFGDRRFYLSIGLDF